VKPEKNASLRMFI